MNGMTVNLKWVLILSMVLAVLGFLVGAGAQFTDLGLTQAEVKAIVAICVLFLGMGNAVNSVLVAFGMNTQSRLAGVASLPEVKSIVTTAAVADAAPSEKVVSTPPKA